MIMIIFLFFLRSLLFACRLGQFRVSLRNTTAFVLTTNGWNKCGRATHCRQLWTAHMRMEMGHFQTASLPHRDNVTQLPSTARPHSSVTRVYLVHYVRGYHCTWWMVGRYVVWMNLGACADDSLGRPCRVSNNLPPFSFVFSSFAYFSELLSFPSSIFRHRDVNNLSMFILCMYMVGTQSHIHNIDIREAKLLWIIPIPVHA